MGFVYLIGDWEKDNVYKIGVTRGRVEDRIKKLQTGNGGEIYLIKSFETTRPFVMEKMLHNKFNLKKKIGEWFELTPEDIKDFQSTCEDLQKTIDALEDNYYFKKQHGTL